jgi:hypothetical protein
VTLTQPSGNKVTILSVVETHDEIGQAIGQPS